MNPKLKKELLELVSRALVEDQYQCDVTSKLCIAEDIPLSADLLLKESGVIAGLTFLPLIVEKIDKAIEVSLQVEEGSFQKKGVRIARITGPAKAILSGERTLINLLQHLSGIATLTARYVTAVKGTKALILDTRKTLPNMRYLQKYAVELGGGKNNRHDLSEAILIKDNHLALLPLEKICDIIEKGRSLYPQCTITIEIDDLKALPEAIKAKPDKILLDNLSPEQLSKAVEITQGEIFLEASGGITLKSVRTVAMTGVDGISIGALTHSVSALDLSLEFSS